MPHSPRRLVPALVLSAALPLAAQEEGDARAGSPLPKSAYGRTWRESMAEVERREAAIGARPDTLRRAWNGQPGTWYVPQEGAEAPTGSGERSVINRWGDPSMGIRFPSPVHVVGLWIAGHGALPAVEVTIRGLAGDRVLVEETVQLDRVGRRVTLGTDGIERLEFRAEGPIDPRAWFALDDLTWTLPGAADRPVVADFEGIAPRTTLTGSGHLGLVWETGTGLRGLTEADFAIQAPRTGKQDDGAPGDQTVFAIGQGTPPNDIRSFDGPRLGDAGGRWIPPDSCGAAGPDHFVSAVNTNLSVWDRDGTRRSNVGLDAFWNVSPSPGDPRIVYDPHSDRFVLLATTFSRTNEIYCAITETGDPLGSWFKWSFRVDLGIDAGRWPDYPTLGVDARGIYTAAYMVGGRARMTIWAIDKSPLLQATPALGTTTAFRGLPFEGAIQPCTTYGDPGAEYLISRASSSALRLRRIDPPLSAPTLTTVTDIRVPTFFSPPNAPALGGPDLWTLDSRPMNAVFRAGSVYTVHGISVSGRAAVRWYEVDTTASPPTTAQIGTVADPSRSYFYGSVAVDRSGSVALGFSGSSPTEYAGAWMTGRLASDLPGETAPPVLVKAGEGPYSRFDGAGRNRWGDYSHITVDPREDLGFWSIQEYAGTGNDWFTWVTRLGYEVVAYGDGTAGTNGVPSLRAPDRVSINTNARILLGNSAGAPSNGVLLVGAARDSRRLLGGTLLLIPGLTFDVPLAGTEGEATIPVPADPTLVDVLVYAQGVVVDGGAPAGLAFSRGLELRIGAR